MKALTQRKPAFRSRALLDAAKHQECVHCGATETVVAAHYTGLRQYHYGRGLAEKAHDFLTAHLCMKCHYYMDTIAKDKDHAAENSEMFLHAIALTWARLFERGILQVRDGRSGEKAA